MVKTMLIQLDNKRKVIAIDLNLHFKRLFYKNTNVLYA
jgi:hypothetical protein